MYLGGPLNEAPDHPTDDKIERQRQTEHEQDQTRGDAQTVERSPALQTGEAFRQLSGNRAQGGYHAAAREALRECGGASQAEGFLYSDSRPDTTRAKPKI